MTKLNHKKGKRSTKGKKPKVMSVEVILEQAQEAMQSVQLEEAAQFYEQALRLQPGNTDIMDSLADVYIQIGNMQRALSFLNESITVAPNSNGMKWLYLAQLLPGPQALGSYQTGLQIMEAQCSALEEEQKLSFRRTMAGAYCSIAELYMTDLCFEDNAERCCEEAVQKSLQLDPNALDTKLTLASLRISQCRKNDAIAILLEICPKVANAIREFRSRNILDDIAGRSDSGEHVEFLPSPETSVSFVKLLMECGGAEQPSFYDSVHDTLEYVLDVDDENPDLWYLLGVNANNRLPIDEETAIDAFSTAKNMLEEMLDKDSSLEDAKCLLQKVEFAMQHIGTPDIHIIAEQKSVQVVCAIAEANGTTAMDEEWSDEDE